MTTRAPAALLRVISLGGAAYEVSGGERVHRVTWIEDDPGRSSCDCADFEYRGHQCKHLKATAAFRAADPQAALLDPLSADETLKLINPPAPRTTLRAIDPEERAIAVRALEGWRRELAAGKRTIYDFDLLWRVAGEAQRGLELEDLQPNAAAERFALAAHWCRQRASGRWDAA